MSIGREKFDIMEGQTGRLTINATLPEGEPCEITGAVRVRGVDHAMELEPGSDCVLLIGSMPKGSHLFEVRVNGATAAYGLFEVKPSPLDERRDPRDWQIDYDATQPLPAINVTLTPGARGKQGVPGLTALDYARQQGYEGTEAEWLGDAASVFNAKTEAESSKQAAGQFASRSEAAEVGARGHAAAAATSEAAARQHAETTRTKATEAEGSAGRAATSESNAQGSAEAAAGSATLAEQNKEESARQAGLAREAANSLTLLQTHDGTSPNAESGAAIEAELNRRVGGMTTEGGHSTIPGTLTVDGSINALQGVRTPTGGSLSTDMALNYSALRALNFVDWVSHGESEYQASKSYVQSSSGFSFNFVKTDNCNLSDGRDGFVGYLRTSNDDEAIVMARNGFVFKNFFGLENSVATVFANATDFAQWTDWCSWFLGGVEDSNFSFDTASLGHRIHWHPNALANPKLPPTYRIPKGFSLTFYGGGYVENVHYGAALLRVDIGDGEEYEWFILKPSALSRLMLVWCGSPEFSWSLWANGTYLFTRFPASKESVMNNAGFGWGIRNMSGEHARNTQKIQVRQFEFWSPNFMKSGDDMALLGRNILRGSNTEKSVPSVTPSTASVPAEGGEVELNIAGANETIHILHDAFWDSPQWVTLSANKLTSGSGEITVTLAPNEAASEREVWLFVAHYNGKAAVVKLTQAGIETSE